MLFYHAATDRTFVNWEQIAKFVKEQVKDLNTEDATLEYITKGSKMIATLKSSHLLKEIEFEQVIES